MQKVHIQKEASLESLSMKDPSSNPATFITNKDEDVTQQVLEEKSGQDSESDHEQNIHEVALNESKEKDDEYNLLSDGE